MKAARQVVHLLLENLWGCADQLGIEIRWVVRFIYAVVSQHPQKIWMLVSSLFHQPDEPFEGSAAGECEEDTFEEPAHLFHLGLLLDASQAESWLDLAC